MEAAHVASLAPHLPSEEADEAADAFAAVLTSAMATVFPELPGVCLDFRTDANVRRYLGLRNLEEVSVRGTIPVVKPKRRVPAATG